MEEERDLKPYNAAEKKLFYDMDTLSFDETVARLHKLGSLIPSIYSINPVRLMNKFKDLFGNHPKRKEFIKTYKIDNLGDK